MRRWWRSCQPKAQRIASAVFLLVISSGLLDLVSAQECAADGVCDRHERCSDWQLQGECYRNPEYMAEQCPISCRNITQIVVGCADIHPQCAVWVAMGDCATNPTNMQRFCPKSCRVCVQKASEVEQVGRQTSLCLDQEERCKDWANQGECETNPNYMHVKCAKSCGKCNPLVELSKDTIALNVVEMEALIAKTEAFGEKQTVEGKDAVLTFDRVRQSVAYMQSQAVLQLPKDLYSNCLNQRPLCSFWAAIGECEKNTLFMTTNCAPACRTCHLLNMEARCPPLDNPQPALVPGGLNQMFEHIVSTAPGNKTLSDKDRLDFGANNMTEYSVAVHSRPSDGAPWVITLDNFLTNEECQSMIQLGYEVGYERSQDVGAQRFDGTYTGLKSAGRTSENAWCSTKGDCFANNATQRIHNRIAQVTGIPPQNSEYFQILKYEVGQFYEIHHDYVPIQRNRHGGPRILTFFMYLSDVEAGGGTHFPGLGITVMPKKGRALLWPSVMDSDPLSKDDRTDHQALPVESGTKFAANGWIHLYDYQAAQERGCN